MKSFRRWAPWLAASLPALPLLVFAAPPTPGTILQQNIRPTPLPAAPGPVINLPAPKQQASQSSLAFPVSHVIIKGNTLIDTRDLGPLVSAVEGKTDHLSELQAAASRITQLYHESGYPLAYAYLPAQKIKDGTVHITVVEPRYDNIDMKLSGRLNEGQARRTLGLESGQPVAQSSLQRGLLLLNRTPGIRVAGTLVPGAQPATSSLDVTIHDTPLLRASAGLDDYGSNATGRVRGLVQASIDDPFGYGGQIAGNVLRTSGGLLQSEGISLLTPDLWNGLRAGAYASHTHYTLGGRFSALDASGHADQVGVFASMPLILAPGRILEARLDALHDRFGQSSALAGMDDDSRLDLIRFGFAGSLADDFGGVTSAGVVATWGDKHIDNAATRGADALGARTAGRFWIGQLRIQRIQNLPWAFRLNAALSGQVASKNLDGSQKLYLGGPYGVMSYAVGEAGGDAGLLARLGLHHAVPLPIPGQLTAGALLQGGEVWLNHSSYAGFGTDNREKLAGAGAELDYRFRSWVDLRLAYVRQLGATRPTSGRNSHGQFWASLQLNL